MGRPWYDRVAESFQQVAVPRARRELDLASERAYNAELTAENRAYQDRVRQEGFARDDRIRADQNARTDRIRQEDWQRGEPLRSAQLEGYRLSAERARNDISHQGFVNDILATGGKDPRVAVGILNASPNAKKNGLVFSLLGPKDGGYEIQVQDQSGKTSTYVMSDDELHTNLRQYVTGTIEKKQALINDDTLRSLLMEGRVTPDAVNKFKQSGNLSDLTIGQSHTERRLDAAQAEKQNLELYNSWLERYKDPMTGEMLPGSPSFGQYREAYRRAVSGESQTASRPDWVPTDATPMRNRKTGETVWVGKRDGRTVQFKPPTGEEPKPAPRMLPEAPKPAERRIVSKGWGPNGKYLTFFDNGEVMATDGPVVDPREPKEVDPNAVLRRLGVNESPQQKSVRDMQSAQFRTLGTGRTY